MSSVNAEMSMRFHLRRWIVVASLVSAGILAVATARFWLPPLARGAAGLFEQSEETAADGPAEDEHEHDHAGHPHASADSLELSEQARRNIALRVDEIQLTAYERALSIPGIVVEREGRSMHAVAAPLTGVVTKVYVTEGQAVTPGEKLFDLRLTHEDVVQSQADFLRTLQELDVIRREVKRLETATRDGAIAGKRLLERKYEQEKQEATLRSQREAMRLHGLSDAQIDEIQRTGKLLPSLTVTAPDHSHDDRNSEAVVLQVQELKVDRGHHVATGEMLAVLTDHDDLLIEGRAFEQDAQFVAKALANNWPVDAVIESGDTGPVTVNDLGILFVGSRVDAQSRAMHFYVRLPNELIHDAVTNARRHIVWRFKPGQRMQIRIPVEKWEKQIVLPIDAVAQDGVETVVFRENGDRFERQAVHVVHRDQLNAVIANDGSLYPGDRVAMNAAHQLLVALKNKSGGGSVGHGHTH
jgi:multidrug efflux pump subunit AcrA (membrane-fusion protein)